jgi:glycosyltransferase involved in cell wall biosynthesis
MKRCQISVVINNYNYGRFLDRALASVQAQRNVGAEIIVVDDGSQDDSRSVLERYQGSANVIYQDNRGQAAAINAGVRVSRGEFISFLDADDWWDPDKLARVFQTFKSDSKVCLVYHRLQRVFSDGTYTGRPIPRTLCRGDLRRRLTSAGGWWPFPLTSAVSVRRSAWNEVGEIPETFRISADAWLVGIYPFVGHVAGLPFALGFYRLHNNNWYRDIDDASMLRRRMAHWQATVEQTNKFLSARGAHRAISLADHFPYQVAAATLSGVTAMQRLELVVRGLCFGGEPNLLRRSREAFHVVSSLPRAGPDAAGAGGFG